MAAIYRVHLYLHHTYNKPTVQYGFPFHSTKHIFEDFSEPGHLFLGNADEADLTILKSHLAELKAKGEGIQALWTEFPGNPSCHTPDLAALRTLADEYGFVLIVDDTVAGTANVDVLPEADIVVTSLTKSFSGYADVMGGSAVLNPAAKRYDELKQIFEKHYRNELYHIDAGILLDNSADYYERSAVHNRNTAAVVSLFEERLKKPNSAISKIFHPTNLPSAELYRKYMRPKTESFTPGYGLLLSVEFVNIEAIAAFHDAAQLYKSPHLGAHVTLILPYVKGIYHKELDVVGQWGMKETQMRIAPGLENTDELLRKFAVAMDAAEGVVAAMETK